MNTLSSPQSAPVAAPKPASNLVFRTNPLSREATAARAALHEISKLTLRQQSDAARIVVEIGGVKTYWSRGLAAVPPYIQLQRAGEDLLLVWNEGDFSLHVFRRAGDDRRFTRLQVVAKHSVIFSHLPRYAFVPGRTEHRASLAQLVALRSLLGLDPASPIADLHIASATRMIGAIVLEPFLARTFRAADDASFAEQSNPAPAAGAAL